MHYNQRKTIILSGTHVTGKEALAIRLSETLHCPWAKGEMGHAAASFGANSQAKRGFDQAQVFGRIWVAKLQRLVPSFGRQFVERRSGMDGDADDSWDAVITCYGMRRVERDAIRQAMEAQGITPIFAILQITPETLSGRTLGAETPELAGRIMANKSSAIELPDEDEQNLFLVDETKDLDGQFVQVMGEIDRFLAR